MKEIWVTPDAELKEPPGQQPYPGTWCAMGKQSPYYLSSYELGFLLQIRVS